VDKIKAAIDIKLAAISDCRCANHFFFCRWLHDLLLGWWGLGLVVEFNGVMRCCYNFFMIS